MITYDDVDAAAGQLADRLRAEQYQRFRGESWLTELVAQQDARLSRAGQSVRAASRGRPVRSWPAG